MTTRTKAPTRHACTWCGIKGEPDWEASVTVTLASETARFAYKPMFFCSPLHFHLWANDVRMGDDDDYQPGGERG